MSAPQSRTSSWLAYPALSVLLAVIWLLLEESVALPTLLAAVALGLAIPRLVAGFLGSASSVRHLGQIARLAGRVLQDLVVSNFVVARLVVDPTARPQPAWVEVPLDLRDPLGIFLLATIITMTPGTLSCVVDEGAGVILVHVLDGGDPPQVVQDIKQRYERLLLAICEGVES